MAIIQGNAKQGSTRGFYPKIINGSLRFNDDDSAYLSWTPASAGNRKTWTWSGWVKKGVGGFETVFRANLTSNNYETIQFTSGDQLRLFGHPDNTNINCTTNAVFRDPSAWYHFVFAVDTTQATASNRVKIYVNGTLQSLSTATYPSQNLDLNINNTTIHHLSGEGSFDGYLANVHFIDGQALTADDFGETKNGVWVAKDYAGTFGTNGFYLTFEDDTEVEAFNTVLYRSQQPSLGVTGVGFKPDLVITKTRGISSGSTVMDSVRGASAMLSTASTGAESTTGGKGIISFDSDGFTLGTDADIGSSNYSNGTDYVAWCWDAGANNAVTGHSSVTYTGNGGTQKISGLPFSPDLVWVKSRTQDEAQNHNLYDTVRGANVRLRTNTTSAEATDNNALMSFDKNGFTLGDDLHHNQSAETYVAWAWDAGDSDPASDTSGTNVSSVTRKTSTTNGFSIIDYTVTSSNNSATKSVPHGLGGNPDFMMVKKRTNNASDNQRWAVYHSALADDQFLKLGDEATDGASTSSSVFDDSAFTSSTFAIGSSGMVGGHPSYDESYICYAWKAVSGKSAFGSYSGTGASGNTVTTGFRPGFLMVKRTDTSGNSWAIWDASRNPFNTMDGSLFPNSSGAEDVASTNYMDFTDTGFTIQNTSAFDNASGATYIYAAFAGSYSDYITDYNTDGSIDSRVKANDTTGFSIVSYHGTGTAGTIGHGLLSAPDMIIAKSREGGFGWSVYHSGIDSTNPADYNIFLHATNARSDDASHWNDTEPTSSVFSVGTNNGTNDSRYLHIAYCWTETTGYSKFGSYTGTGVAGNAVTGLGFTPSLIMIKRTDSTGDWIMVDNTRGSTSILRSNLSNAESVGYWGVESQSDGFEITISRSETNASGGTYIYAAFADTREAAFWLDQSGNDNDWQPVNLDHNDTVADSPTNNFATLNPLNRTNAGSLSDGNLVITSGSGVNHTCIGTYGMSSGKYYWEATLNSLADSAFFGIIRGDQSTADMNIGLTAGDFAYLLRNNGTVYRNGSTQADVTSYLGAGVVFRGAYDADTGKFWIGVNDTWYGSGGTPDVSAGTNPLATVDSYDSFAYLPWCRTLNATMTFNFGQQPFKYDPPA